MSLIPASYIEKSWRKALASLEYGTLEFIAPNGSEDAIRDIWQHTEGVSGSAFDDLLKGTNDTRLLATKDELFRTSDIISVHLILSDRSRGLVGKSEVGLMKSSALLVNTSRGPIVHEAALVEALQARRIAGAAMDVFDREPLSAEHPLRSLPNVLATPHIGYVADDLYRTFYQDTVSNIVSWMAKRGGVDPP